MFEAPAYKGYRTWVQHLGQEIFLRKGLVIEVAGNTGVVANTR